MQEPLTALRVTEYIPSTHELGLAVQSAKKLYAEASYMLEQACRNFEEAIDDCDREARAAFLRLIDLATIAASDAWIAQEAAYGAYRGRTN